MNNLESKDMDMEAKAQALREAVEGGASNSDLVQMLAEIQAAERERCAAACEHFAADLTDGKLAEALRDMAALMRRMRA